MGQLRAKKGGALVGALVVSSALATGGFNGAPAANATCFSAFGIGNGNGCTSNLTTIAIGIGPGATANASLGFFSSAVAIGNGASATAAMSAFTNVTAFGDGATAGALFTVLGMVTQIGPGTAASIGGPNFVFSAAPLVGSPPANSGASGLGNLVFQFGPGTASTVGLGNFAIGMSPWGDGSQNTVSGPFFTAAFNLYNNSVAAAQGFLALAVKVLNVTLWPFPPLVSFIDAVVKGIEAILRIFGFSQPPAALAGADASSLAAEGDGPEEPAPAPALETAAAAVDDSAEVGVAGAAAASSVDGEVVADDPESLETPAETPVEDITPDEAVDTGATDDETDVDAEESDEIDIDAETDTDTGTDTDDPDADQLDDAVAAAKDDDEVSTNPAGSTETSGGRDETGTPGGSTSVDNGSGGADKVSA